MAITKDIKTAKSVQEIWNLGFDTDFNLPVVESLIYNPVTQTMDRNSAVQGNASLSITEVTVGDVTTKTILKTIGATTYTKTVVQNNVTNALTVSSWS